MDQQMQRLADRVRVERLRRHLGQQDVADQAGVKVGMVSNFERHKTTPQPGNLRAILRVLELEAEAGDATGADTRSEWPVDVQTFLDIMGIFLAAMPEEKRTQVIHDITRQIAVR